MSKMLQSFSPESDGWQFMWIILVVFLIGLGFSIERIIYIMVKFILKLYNMKSLTIFDEEST